MSDALTITPDEPFVGSPINLELDLGKISPAPHHAVVRKIDTSLKNTFDVELKAAGAAKMVGQFALYEAGLYQVEAGTLSVPLRIRPTENIPFFVEVGFLGGMVCLILGGIILWSKRRKDRV